MLTTVSIIAVTITNVVNSASWAYVEPGNNASHWPDYYAECGYSRQSPIDIPLDDNYECASGSPLELQWTSELSHYAIRNNGHSLQAIPFNINHAGGSDLSGLEVLHHRNDTNIKLQNLFYHTYESGISKQYCFDSLHFHWGATDGDGSEHTVNGESFPLEVHLVHYSCDYAVAGDALTDYSTGRANIKYDDDNVLAVIGVIFEIGKPNPVLTKILDDIIIDGIKEKASQTEATKLDLYYTEFDTKGLLPESRDIISYLGSLTTPPCFETVRWHVVKERMTVSEEQMAKFRQLLASDVAEDVQHPNYRPTMPLNDRTIYQCQEDLDDGALFTDNDEKDKYLAGDDTVIIAEDTDNSETDVDEQTSDASGMTNMTESELMWRMIGIAFICLFMMTLIVCLIAAICLCKHWDQICNKPKPTKSPRIHSKHCKLEIHPEDGHMQHHNMQVMGASEMGKL